LHYIIGIAKGFNEISDWILISSFTLSFFIPLCLLNSPVNKGKPEEVIIKPSESFKEFSVIPKNNRIIFLAKNEGSNSIKTLSDIQNAILFKSN